MAAPKLYEVVPMELNLRSNTQVVPQSVIARLRQGQQVQKLVPDVAPPAGWLWVQANLQGTLVQGFVNAAFLKEVNQPAAGTGTPALPNIAEAYLRRTDPVLLSQDDDGSRVFDLTTPNQPGRPGPFPENKAVQLAKIISFLKVSTSPRYDAARGKTYCNIYAHDYCHLAGAYLPRVWWTRRALVALAAGQPQRPAYGTTVQELNANSLYNWLEEFGPDFGWRRTVSLTEMQQAANTGQVCIISGQRKDLNTPGHICAVVPETAQHTASWQAGQVTVPLMSQAGGTNFEYGGRVWWHDARFGRHSFWVHA